VVTVAPVLAPVRAAPALALAAAVKGILFIDDRF
jgi:hypothetical protein